jgi:hypothetical protein
MLFKYLRKFSVELLILQVAHFQQLTMLFIHHWLTTASPIRYYYLISPLSNLSFGCEQHF